MKLPQPAPDELGYNIISRHAEVWRHRDDLGLWQAWAGKEAGHRPMVEVVAGTGRLASFVFPHAKDPQRRFLREHTLAPYFFAFMGGKQKASALEALLGDTPSVARCFERSLLPDESRYLRYCPICAALQVRRGLTYWTRTAQLPGLSRCVFHGADLLMSDVTVEMRRSSDRLQPLDKSVLNRCKTPCQPMMRRDLEARIAVHSLYALRRGFGKSDATSVEHYRRRLMCLGYGNNRGTLRAQLLDADFRGWLHARKVRLGDFGPGAWWLRLVTRIGTSFVPLQHLLMTAFISDMGRQWRAMQPGLLDDDGQEVFVSQSVC